MFKKMVIIVILGLVLVGCGPTTSSDVVDKDHVTSFEVLCDTTRNIGMYTYAYKRGMGDRMTGYGYAIRMTDAEYEQECSRYE